MHTLNRRQFHATVLATGLATGSTRSFAKEQQKLRIAMIGSGGRGLANLNGILGNNPATNPDLPEVEIVALCDVNEAGVKQAAMKAPQAKHFTDFRKLFEKPDTFDAVVVSTCEHTHYHATMLALKNGKHVYCEKPLSHSIWEARQLREAAAKAKVATQMGIQIHAGNNYRTVVEIIQAGVIGPVTEVHVWVSRAWGLQSPAEAKANGDILDVQDLPKETAEVPKGLDWDLWIGPAPMRPFHPIYVPGPKWYRWWDFGSGTMSDLGSHWNDLPFWALKLQAPIAISANGPDPHPALAPASMSATYEYPARGEAPPVKMTWYQGALKPKIWQEKEIPQWGNGVLFIGKKGMLLADYGKYVLLPEGQFKGFQAPKPTLDRVPNHYAEWLMACKTGKPCSASFEYSGWLTEANHLGNVVFRVGRKIKWDAEKLQADAKEAAPLIKRIYRKGWDEI